MFKKLEINIPFLEALTQMSHYAKFMKDILIKKRKFDEDGVVNLLVTCSCTIGNYEFGRPLYDSGVSINLMPLSMVKRLSLGKLSPTTMTLQMTNRFVAQPEGIFEDVLIKVGKFIFPVDFVVIDFEEEKKVPLLLGRPFLAIGATLIDVKKGELTLRVGDEAVHFNLNHSFKQPDFEKAECKSYENVVPISSQLNDDCKNQDSMNEKMMNFQYIEDLDTECLNASVKLKETVLSLNEENAEKSSNNEEKVRGIKKSFEGLIMKELPKHPKYAFLGDERAHHVIIVAKLT